MGPFLMCVSFSKEIELKKYILVCSFILYWYPIQVVIFFMH